MGRRTIRVDDLLVARGLADTRDEAQRAIIAGEVSLGNRKAKTGGELVPLDTPVHMPVKGRFVSRGGEKLAGALDAFSFDPSGLSCIDIGASTGGFTDCLLKAGAAAVTAVDVGYGQLAWSLRTDERVTVFERTNIRQADPASLGGPFDLAVSDVSFIRLASILPVVTRLLKSGGHLITLIKPQFEAPPELVGRHGVVQDASTHEMVIEHVIEACSGLGLACRRLGCSPILGPEGNMEFLLLAAKDGRPADLDVAHVVAQAHRRFGR